MRLRKGIVSLCWSSVRLHLECGTRWTLINWSEFSGGSPKWSGGWSISIVRCWEEWSLFCLGMRWLGGTWWKPSYKEINSYPVEEWDSRQNLKWDIPAVYQDKSFHHKDNNQWKELSREVVSGLGGFTDQSRQSSEQSGLISALILLWAGGWNRRSFQSKWFSDTGSQKVLPSA